MIKKFFCSSCIASIEPDSIQLSWFAVVFKNEGDIEWDKKKKLTKARVIYGHPL
jgi:hypothetical protein